jgi:hypothetical protein
MLTTTLREQAAELVDAAGRAEEEAIAAIERALVERRASAARRGVRIQPLDPTRLAELFACVDEIPLAGLRAEAAACRARLLPELERGFDGRLLYRGDRLVGHLIWAPLEVARYPVAARGVRWLVFCPWLAREERGQGLGPLLFGALDEAARAARVDGLLTFATSLEVFLHHRGYERHGFAEIDRRGDTRLLERRLTEAPSEARFVDPPPPRAGGPLPVVVRHTYNCPLLLRARRDTARAAASLAPRAAVDQADAQPGDPAGVTVGGKAIAHGPLPFEAIAQALAAEAEDWSS